MSDALPEIIKYPRTPHLEDSRLQPGDEGMGGVPFRALQVDGADAVYEEKVDGGNSGFRFAPSDWSLLAQSRGRYLDMTDRNSPRDRDFTLFKDWLRAHEAEFLDRFEDRYIVYGEWMQVTHTVFYDRLPSLFLEFDIFDTHLLAKGFEPEDCFLDTPRRRELCRGLPIASVPILYSGPARSLAHMKSLLGPSAFRSPDVGRDVGGDDWRANLRRACALVQDDYEARLPKMAKTDTSEGFYIKVERDGRVIGRYKWVRADFVQQIQAADEHWQSRFPVPNLLETVTDVFPPYLARDPASVPPPYDPDSPWGWAPWLPGGPQAAGGGVAPR